MWWNIYCAPLIQGPSVSIRPTIVALPKHVARNKYKKSAHATYRRRQRRRGKTLLLVVRGHPVWTMTDWNMWNKFKFDVWIKNKCDKGRESFSCHLEIKHRICTMARLFFVFLTLLSLVLIMVLNLLDFETLRRAVHSEFICPGGSSGSQVYLKVVFYHTKSFEV